MSTMKPTLPAPGRLHVFRLLGDMAVLLDPTGERAGLSISASGALTLAAAGVGVRLDMTAADWRALGRLAAGIADELEQREAAAEAAVRAALAKATERAADA